MDSIFSAVTGSRAYGTAIATSDTDIKGVYVQPASVHAGFGYQEQVSRGKDETHYEIKRFVQLLSSANPTVLELLFAPPDTVKCKQPAFEVLERARHLFVTKKCEASFGGYAVAQIRKARGLDKKMNWERDRVERKGPMDFCYAYHNGKTMPLRRYIAWPQESYGLVGLDHFRDCYALYQDERPNEFRGIVSEDGNDVRVSSVPEGRLPLTVVHFNRDGYSQHCKDYREYLDWERNRNVQRYVDTAAHGQRIDGKNMLHCRRLLDMALEIAREGVVRVRRPNAAYLLSIRRGEVDLESLLARAEDDVQLLKEEFNRSSLPTDVEEGLPERLLEEARTVWAGAASVAL